MLKNYTRQLFAQLSRHLPRRLVQRDPLPDARHLASGPIPESLGQHCLNVAAMDDQEIWRAFDSHPEGLNEGEVAAKILKHGDNQIPAQKPSPWWVHLWTCYRNPFNLLLTVLGIVSYSTEDLFAAGVIALMVGISTLLNFIQEARSTKAADALKAMVSKGFRNPVLRELYMFGVKNPDLKPERLWNYELSWTQRLAGGSVSYGVNLFYIKGEDIIRRGRADGRNILLNQARIENWGAEADAAWRIGGGWSVNANYSWLRMEYPVPASPEHKLYAGGDFGKGRWSVSTGVQYIAGLYTAAAPDPEVREAGFVLWNLRASLRVNRLLTIFVRGENLLAERYEINAGYPMPRATVFGGLKLNL